MLEKLARSIWTGFFVRFIQKSYKNLFYALDHFIFIPIYCFV